MPTYQYRCQDCSSELEVVQKFTDRPLTRCPTCQGSLRKVYSPVGVVFKGSGFYATDSRASKKKVSASKPGGADTKHHHGESKSGTAEAKTTAAKTSSDTGAPAA